MGFGEFVAVERVRVFGNFDGAFEFISKKEGEFLVFEGAYALAIGFGHAEGFSECLGLPFDHLSVTKPPEHADDVKREDAQDDDVDFFHGLSG